MLKIAFVIATKDRPKDLREMLLSVRVQTRRPEQIVIVDASKDAVEAVVQEFPELNTCYKQHWPPSAAAQRNAGLAAVEPDIGLIGFMDDDIVLEPDALERMLKLWETASPRVGGAAFNCLNGGPRRMAMLKKSRIASSLGLYTNEIEVWLPAVGRRSPDKWKKRCGSAGCRRRRRCGDDKYSSSTHSTITSTATATWKIWTSAIRWESSTNST